MMSSRQRGSALMVTLVVLLALSAIGIGIVSLMESQAKSAASTTHVKDALYVAEMGLRRGENLLLAQGPDRADTLLQHVASAANPAVAQSVPLYPDTPAQYDVNHLGTYLLDVSNAEVAGQSVALPPPSDGKPMPQAFFSLYVRNNEADTSVADYNTSSNAREDNDRRLNLVSVGWVQSGNRVLAVKILEEEYSWVGVTQGTTLQKLKDSGGTSSGQFGGG